MKEDLMSPHSLPPARGTDAFKAYFNQVFCPVSRTSANTDTPFLFCIFSFFLLIQKIPKAKETTLKPNLPLHL